MQVTNINGTSKNNCKCENWLDHWKKYSKRSLPAICVEKTCTKLAEVGAHVQKSSDNDKSWYIVPLCKTHNGQTETLNIVDTVVLVPANVSNTCG